MANTTYSFQDINCIIAPTGFGSASVVGSGAGSINVAFTNNNSEHSVSADGSVMTSKIVANNGTITIVCQQTSPLNRYLINLFNSVYTGPSSLWAGITITISSPDGLFQYVVAEGCSLQKRADQSFQQTGQDVTWTFMASRIEWAAGGGVTSIL